VVTRSMHGLIQSIFMLYLWIAWKESESKHNLMKMAGLLVQLRNRYFLKCSVTDQHTWCGRTEYLLSSFKSVIMEVHQWYATFPMTDYSLTFLPFMWFTFQNSAGMFTPYLEQMSIPMQSHWFDYYNNIKKLY